MSWDDDDWPTGNEPRQPDNCTCHLGYCNGDPNDHSEGGSMS